MTVAMRTCTYHCRGYPYGGCDTHFSSLDAFDRHRREGACLDPEDVGLESHGGRCDLQRPPVDGLITIWAKPLTWNDRRRLSALAARR
jgi:hypothetical protein